MTQSLLRTNFISSRLICLFADLFIVDGAESKQVFAERLSQWLDFSDAITLHAAHSGSAASSSAAPFRESVAGVVVEEEFARVRTALVNSITTSFSPNNGATRIKLPTPKPGAGIEAAAYGPYRRFYLAHQGEMESLSLIHI